ncbi:MAG TPA: YCF48-related protein [Terriglobales bacterium]|nr:YCF48-related protein [Terriglobales bacterium]
MRRRRLLIAISVLISLRGLIPSTTFGGENAKQGAAAPSLAVVDQLDRPAVQTHAAEHSVLTDVTRAGTRLVAVGERGIVIFSDDGGHTWTQGSVPTSVSLTAVKFVSPRIGWAVGHGNIVLHTEDGGATWTRQLDGRIVAKLAIEHAQSRLNTSGANKDAATRSLADAQRLETDGPDKPFLDLYFENETTGFVAGAYGLIFRTEDGGKSWQPWMDHVDNPRGMHVYAIAALGDSIYLAGEQGLFLRSTDKGEKFTRIATPYQGTYFTLAVIPSGEIFIGGMRGNAFCSTDQGKTFKPVAVPVPVSFSAVTVTSAGGLVFANQAGQLLTRTDNGQALQPLSTAGLPPISGIVEAGNGLLMTVGFGGVIPVPLNEGTAQSKAGTP